MIDLHTHSTASDGTVPPGELAVMAREAGLSAWALTDHDTTAGLSKALDASLREGVDFVPGVELSVRDESGAYDLLGLWVPTRAPALERALEELNLARAERNTAIVDKLAGLGLDVSLREVVDLAEGTVGRPHMARLLVDKGYARSIPEAFDLYLGTRGKAYVPKAVLTPAEAIGLLKDEGATVLLAHPAIYDLHVRDIEALCARLKEYGLDGLEAYYSEHTRNKTYEYLCLAKRLDMVVGGGSDYHGSVKPNLRLGRGKGFLEVPDSVLDNLKAYRAARGLPSRVPAES
ncbi:PHP domain-containing protein [Desulfohalovibrio reitneri]|uniref:PHP domain-containing protein n=1 Tax=Desulfohalovibrio reitneri TaxID=1307759 RepID=UPI0004A6BCD1|nr:PHP domain-containing protein [Desulfohalovibrio reitneri]